MTAGETEQRELKRMRATTHFERGRHLFNANRFGEALAAIDEALNEDPEFLRAYTAKANALTMLGRAQEAAAICDEVLAKDSDFALAYTTRASALHRAGRRDEALADYRRGVELAPGEHLTHYNFACFWALEGNEAECEKYLRRALEIDPRAKPKAATDADFASVRGEEWFQELVAL
jgi:tetratricopeptide (TPR) repeat protein